MKKEIAIELERAVQQTAQNYSDKSREMNWANDTFSVERIIPTSEHTANVIFRKSSGKIGVAFFYYLPNGTKKGWRHIFPTDAHIQGMRAFEFIKIMAEEENFQWNFIKK